MLFARAAAPPTPRARAVRRARPSRARRYAPLHPASASVACRSRSPRCARTRHDQRKPERRAIETDDDLAWERLVAAGIADALLGNDRAILSRYDDSVVRVVNGAIMPVRRARGYAPQPLPLPALDGAPSCVLACGPQQKATIALTREGTNGEATCFVSQHIGDVENGGTFDAWNAARTRLEDLFDLAPAALACDLHPSYLSDQWAREQARKCNLPLVEVQHHHAHIASVMAEAIAAGQLTTDTRVLGIAFDAPAPAPMGPFGAASFLLPALTALSAPRICSPGRSPAWRLRTRRSTQRLCPAQRTRPTRAPRRRSAFGQPRRANA